MQRGHQILLRLTCSIITRFWTVARKVSWNCSKARIRQHNCWKVTHRKSCQSKFFYFSNWKCINHFLKQQECCRNEYDEDSSDFISIISAFQIPKFVYNSERKKYLPCGQPSHNLFGESKDKAEMFRHRYALLHQRYIFIYE